MIALLNDSAALVKEKLGLSRGISLAVAEGAVNPPGRIL
jgi:hypothetical protein